MSHGGVVVDIAERFTGALAEAERAHDPGPLLPLFDDGSVLETVGRDEPETGRDGARRFWERYLGAFERIGTTFEDGIDDGHGRIALEWVSEGVLRSGHPVRYRGVTVVHVDGGRVRRLCTYYDSAVFTPGGSKIRL